MSVDRDGRYEVHVITPTNETQQRFGKLSTAKNAWAAAFSEHCSTEVVEIALHDLVEEKTLQTFIRGGDK